MLVFIGMSSLDALFRATWRTIGDMSGDVKGNAATS